MRAKRRLIDSIRRSVNGMLFRRTRLRPEARKDQALLAHLDGVDWRPVFILGEARSGSTILYELLYQTGGFNIVTLYHLASESELVSNHLRGETAAAEQRLDCLMREQGITDRGIDHIPARHDTPMEYAYVLVKETGTIHVTPDNAEFFEQFCKKVQLISDRDKPLLLKNIADGRNFLTLHELFPEARFVFIHREPLDILVSQLRAIFAPRNELLAVVSSEYRGLAKSRTYTILVKWLQSRWGFGLLCRALVRLSMKKEAIYVRDLPSLPKSQWMSLRYEDLCRDPNGEVRRILEFLGHSWPEGLDLSSRVSPRQMKPLPEVEKRRAKLERLFAERRRRHGYISG